MTKIIQGLDILDIVGFISKRNRKNIVILLQSIEQVIDKDSQEYKKIRSLILDSMNDYTRSILRIIFGTDFEGVIK